MQVKGKLFEIFDTQQVTDTFKKREFVLEYADNPLYPQYVLFQLTQDRVGLLDTFSKGSMIEVEFNLRGRSWKSPQGETRYFNSLEAWRINPVQAAVETPSAPDPVPPDAIDVTEMGGDDDLPF